ncbi:MAG: Maf family protein, partial [Bacteroidales bacterium]|nr:Maf family protein [Bacteroidales bacterium]
LVVTGVCLRSVDKVVSFSVKTEVTFSKLDDEEIRFYIENFKPFDKAGAYGIQEWIGKVAVEGINGSFYNVVGLPVQRLYRELKKF